MSEKGEGLLEIGGGSNDPFCASLLASKPLLCSDGFRRAYRDLLAVAGRQEGFAILCGADRVGKTTLLRYLSHALVLTGTIVESYAPNGLSAVQDDGFSPVSPREPAAVPNDGTQCWQSVRKRIMQVLRENKSLVLVIDDADALADDLLVDLFSLRRQHAHPCGGIAVMLAGSETVASRIAATPYLTDDRLVTVVRLTPLAAEDVRIYVAEALVRVGRRDTGVFPPETIARVALLSGGLPGVVNDLCSRALAIAADRNLNSVTPDVVNAAASLLPGRGKPEFIATELDAGANTVLGAAPPPPRPADDNAFPTQTSPVLPQAQPLPILKPLGGDALAPVERASAASTWRRYAPLTASAAMVAAVLGGIVLLDRVHREGEVLGGLQNGTEAPVTKSLRPLFEAGEPSKPEKTAEQIDETADRTEDTGPSTPRPVDKAASSGDAQPRLPYAAANAQWTGEPTSASEPQDGGETASAGSTVPDRPSPSELVTRGDQMLELSDLVAARLFYARAVALGSAPAMTAIGGTYDPLVLAEASVRGGLPDLNQAMVWYGRAIAAGDGMAELRLNRLLEQAQTSAGPTLPDAPAGRTQ